MDNKNPASRELVAALIRLNNISQGKAADLAGLVRQNVSSWYTGRDNALSQVNQLKLLATLGVSYGSLRNDGVHRWCVRDVEDPPLVLRAVLNERERTNLHFWHVHNSRYPGCIILKTANPNEATWVLMYRPLMAEPPQPITAETLGCGIDMGDVIIDNATWESWLPPAVLEPAPFGKLINKLINQFPYPLPPQQYFDEMEDPDGQNADDISQDALMGLLAPTAEELKKWNEVLYQAKLGGKGFDEIVSATRKALGVRVFGDSRRASTGN